MFEEEKTHPVDQLDWTITIVALGALLAFVGILAGAWALGALDGVTGIAGDINTWLWKQTGTMYLLAFVVFLLFVVGLLVSPWGSKKLGDVDPEYSYPLYFSMVFSAGIAAGIVFWGPAEAIYHFEFVPPYVGAEGGSAAAASGAIKYTMFHWGFSPWAAYAAIAIPVAYYAYNHDAPLRVSSLLSPLVGLSPALTSLLGGEDLDGPLAKLVDILAVFATLGGLTTTVGLISQQFLEGTGYAFAAQAGDLGTIAIIAGFTAIFTVSVVTGVKRGIKRIALVNVALFALIAVGIFLVGPTMEILTGTVVGFGSYIVELPIMSVYNGETGSLIGAGDWVGATWTVFYWAWWLSWAPFVGLFIARISKGRTIREVVVTGVIAPTLATLAWFGIMGNTAIHLQRTGQADILGALGQEGTTEAVAAFPLFEALPFGDVLMLGFLGLVITFLVTSADTATLSLSMLTSYGRESPPTSIRIVWGVAFGVVAAVVLLVGGAGSLQQAAIITGGPFAVIAVLGVVAMALDLAAVGPFGTAPEQEPEPGLDDGSLGDPNDEPNGAGGSRPPGSAEGVESE